MTVFFGHVYCLDKKDDRSQADSVSVFRCMERIPTVSGSLDQVGTFFLVSAGYLKTLNGQNNGD
jgi:hypothetical protein